MEPQIFSFFVVLALVWFLVYWILGGVFFALVTIMRLGRMRKVRFSCLFTMLALLLGVGAAHQGIGRSQEAVAECLADAKTKAEMVTAVFGCGFATIFGAFLIGALVLAIGGFLIMAVSKSKTKPWIILEPQEEAEHPPTPPDQGPDSPPPSQFF